MTPAPDESSSSEEASAVSKETDAKDTPAKSAVEGSRREELDEADVPDPAEKGSYRRVILQLALILPCAVMIVPTAIMGVAGIAGALRGDLESRSLIAMGVPYFLGFCCMAAGIFLPARPQHRAVWLLAMGVVFAGLPLFTSSALTVTHRFRGEGEREFYETLAIFGGPIVVTVWNLLRLGGRVEAPDGGATAHED
jgi:hypothetical protein